MVIAVKQLTGALIAGLMFAAAGGVEANEVDPDRDKVVVLGHGSEKINQITANQI